MRLGILSDTHDELDRTRQAIELLRAEGADSLIHCGDLASPEVVEVLAALPSWFVFGNHDADVVPRLRAAASKCGVNCLGWRGSVAMAGKRVAVTHGHMSSDVRHVLASEPDYLLSGHSHIAADEVVDGVRRINPGALSWADEFTVAVLEVASGELRFLRVPGSER